MAALFDSHKLTMSMLAMLTSIWRLFDKANSVFGVRLAELRGQNFGFINVWNS